MALRDSPQDVPTIGLPSHDARLQLGRRGDFVVVRVLGHINESFPTADVAAHLHGQVLLDLSQVDLVTSYGVRAWLNMLRLATFERAYIVSASPAVIRQINMIRGFCGPARILSVIAPYQCACGHAFGRVLDALEDRAAMVAGRAPVAHCSQCGSVAEFDEDVDTFFSFVDRLATEVTDSLRWAAADLDELAPYGSLEPCMPRPSQPEPEPAVASTAASVGSRTLGVLFGSMVLAVLLLGMAGSVLFWVSRRAPEPAGQGPVAWSNGELLAPAWIDSPEVVTKTGWLVSASAEGATEELALALAREEAARRARSLLGVSSGAPEPSLRSVETISKAVDGGVRVAARFEVLRDAGEPVP
ncbi:MAG: hypothetical protein KTR31_25670 [Myxococcales bacterium]|nr:hypothetical protein [Myxococcales bacterium]